MNVDRFRDSAPSFRNRAAFLPSARISAPSFPNLGFKFPKQSSPCPDVPAGLLALGAEVGNYGSKLNHQESDRRF